MKINPLFRILSGFLSADKWNANSDRIEGAFQNTVSRDGSGPNAMLADLDLNGHRIFNLPNIPVDLSEAASKWYVDSIAVSGLQGPPGPEGPMGADGATGPTGDTGTAGADGFNGWSPVFSVVTDSSRRVLQVSDWQGGTGTKPTTGLYVSATGLTSTLASAVDIRGPQGVAGAGTGDLLSTNNLSDLTNAGTARTNLGLGTAATHANGDYATAVHTHVATDITDSTAVGRSVLTAATAGDARAALALGTASTHDDTEYADAVHTHAAADIGDPTGIKTTESLIIAVSDETTAITTGTAKVTFRMPYAFTVTSVRASLTTASSSGIPTVDINEAGVSILSTKLTMDVSEKTSTTAATAPVISDATLADDAEMTIDIDVAGTGAKGLKVYIIGHRS